MIPHPPTEIATVHQLLERSLAIAHQLGQSSVPVVSDQVVDAKAKEIVWKEPANFSPVVLLLGGFHTAMVFFVYPWPKIS